MRALVLVLALALPACAAKPTSPERADRLLARRVRAGGPGIAAAVLRGAEVVYQSTRGMADVQARVPVTGSSLFDLASCSKQFTGLAIALLAADGALSVDDPVRQHLPELPARSRARPIRLRHLLAMTDGQLPAYDEQYDSFEGVTNADVVKFIAGQELAYPTGTRHEYSNTAYCELGLVVARLGGGYGAFLKKRIFEPAGMARSVALESPDQELPGQVTGYKKGKPSSNPNWIVGDGNVFSTLDDMIRYHQALANGTIPAAVQKVTTTPGKLENGAKVDYNYGLGLGRDDVGRWVAHSGSWDGTATYLSRYLAKDGLSVIVLSNEETLDVQEIGDTLLEVFQK